MPQRALGGDMLAMSAYAVTPTSYVFSSAQNHLNDRFISDCRIHHRVINRMIRPLHVEISPNEIGALPVHGIHKLFGLLLGLVAR